MNSTNPETHTCDCGFTWRHGHSGAHSCGPYYQKTIAKLRTRGGQLQQSLISMYRYKALPATSSSGGPIMRTDTEIFESVNDDTRIIIETSNGGASLRAEKISAPIDCSGTPASCPDNEGYGCACSPAAVPQVTALVQASRAKKIGGSYQADGTIVSTFATLAGETRHVFEFDQPAGMLHIFGPGQVEIAAAPQVVADEPKDGINQLLENSHLQHILKKADEAREANDMGRRARAAFEELCEFIFDYRCAAAPVPSNSPELHGIAAAPVQVQEPFAYAVYGINGAGEHFLDAIKEVAEAEDGEWSIDDNGNGDRWAGNAPLYRAPVQPVAVPDGDAPGYKPQAKETVFYSRLGLSDDGLPFMTDSSVNGPWDIAMVFEKGSKRPSKFFSMHDYLAAPAAHGDANTTTKETCKNCGGEGRFYKTVMSDFGSGEREETVCKVCVGSGVIYSAIAAKAAS